MKLKVYVIMILATVFSMTVKAQSQDETQRLDSLVKVVTNMERRIQLIQHSVNEVLKQNLALKQAIHLQPTIAESTSSEGINFRIIKAIGDAKNEKVIILLSVLNQNDNDIDLQLQPLPLIVDELGHVTDPYKDLKYWIGYPDAVAISKLLPQTPVEMTIEISTPFLPQYIKNLNWELYRGGKNIRFTNIPIKW